LGAATPALAVLLFAGAGSWPAPGVLRLTAAADVTPAPLTPQVLVVGDSVAAGVAATGKLADLQARLPGWQVTFDAQTDRSTSVGAQLVSAAGPRRFQVVILALGENDGTRAFPEAMKAMMSVVAAVPRVYWLTVRESRRYPWLPGINAMIRQTAPSYSNLAVADWNQYGAAHPADFWGDGLHLTPSGGADMAAFLADLVNDTSPYARPLTPPTLPPTTAPASSRYPAVIPHAASASTARNGRGTSAAVEGIGAGLAKALRVVLDGFVLLLLLGAAAVALSPSCRHRRRLHRARLARIKQRTLAAPSPY
jgi:lysophospholipase L1-like esterase